MKTPLSIEEAEKILSVSAAGPARELRDAYRRAAFREHPDRGGDASLFAAVKEAYKALSVIATPDPCAERTLDGLVKERADLPRPDSSTRGTKADDGLGDWLKRQVPAGARPPEKVAFEKFHETFSSMARPGCGTLVPSRVRELPTSCGMAAAPVSGGARDRNYSSGTTVGGGRLQFADLRSAYGVSDVPTRS